MIHLSKKSLFFFLLVVLILIFISLGFAFGRRTFPFASEKWQVIQLSDNSLYYGQLKTFPCCQLVNAYFIQEKIAEDLIEGESAEITGAEISPFGYLFFEPENTMHLQKENILWWANLSADSPVLQMIKNQR